MTTMLCLATGAFYLTIQLVKLVLACVYVRRARQARPPERLEESQAAKITIVQPILSGDPQLESILRFNVDHLPDKLQFIWLIDEDDEAGRAIASKIQHNRIQRNRLPSIEVILCKPPPENTNPKTYKLQIALEQCSREYFVVLDDDTMISEASLSGALHGLIESDLYTGLPSYRRGANGWADLVAHFVNNNSVLTYLPTLVFAAPVSINGMYYVTRSATLQGLNGFVDIDQELCDDYAVRRLFARAGKHVTQGILRQEISTSIVSAKQYVRIMHRWMLFALMLTRDQPIVLQLVLAVLLGLPPILLWICVLTSLWNLTTLALAACVLLIRQTIIWAAQRFAFGEGLSYNPAISIVSELLQPLHLVSAACYPIIRWRNKSIRVRRGQAFEILVVDKLSR